MDTKSQETYCGSQVREMEDMGDAEVYKYLVASHPEGKVMLNDKEQADFENWLERHRQL